jgi:hypothetical protein
MHPGRELNRLAGLKAARQRGIAYHRAQCATAAARVLQPVEWVDEKLAVWRRLSPIAKLLAIPVGLLLKRVAAPRLRVMSTLLRWGPVLFGVVRGLSASRQRASR